MEPGPFWANFWDCAFVEHGEVWQLSQAEALLLEVADQVVLS